MTQRNAAAGTTWTSGFSIDTDQNQQILATFNLVSDFSIDTDQNQRIQATFAGLGNLSADTTQQASSQTWSGEATFAGVGGQSIPAALNQLIAAQLAGDSGAPPSASQVMLIGVSFGGADV